MTGVIVAILAARAWPRKSDTSDFPRLGAAGSCQSSPGGRVSRAWWIDAPGRASRKNQVADGLTFTLAHHGVELNPLMAHLGGLVLPVKLAGATVVGFLAWRLRGHPQALLWMGAVGWIVALSNFTGY